MNNMCEAFSDAKLKCKNWNCKIINMIFFLHISTLD